MNEKNLYVQEQEKDTDRFVKLCIRYAFTDTSGVNRTGTFWFHLAWDDGFLDYTVESITDFIEEM